MHLESIQFRNFRNLKDEFISPAPGFNLLIGNNAQGKTNVIESIYLFACGRSFRTSEFRDLIHHDQPFAEVRMRVTGDAGFDDLKVRIDDRRKEFFRNEKKARIGVKSPFGVVLFAPEEIMLLKGSPAARRRYIDLLINQVVPAHMALIRKYERVVSQRNGIIQSDDISVARKAEMLRPWDEQLVMLGAKTIMERHRWLGKINSILPLKYESIAPSDGTALWNYQPKCGADVLGFDRDVVERRLADLLVDRREDEMRRRITLVGPHRDDLSAEIGGREVRNFGSQGQHRTFVLALKVAEIEFLRREKGHVPLLLLDDVMSELDESRNNYLFDYLSRLDGQVFITTTTSDEAGIGGDMRPLVFDVCGGSISARKRPQIVVCGDQA